MKRLTERERVLQTETTKEKGRDRQKEENRDIDGERYREKYTEKRD